MASRREWAQDKEASKTAEHGNRSVIGPLVQQLTTLTRHLLNATSVTEALDRIVRTTAAVVPGGDLVSITLRSPDGVLHTPAETESLATELDRIQYETNEGPCLTAAGAGPGYVLSNELGDEPRWPRFGPAAAAHGVRTALAIGLLTDSRSPRYSGALNLYSFRPCGLPRGAHDMAQLLASHASLALAETAAVTRADLTEAQLRQAIESRDVIGQAKGILMHQRDVDADAAFDLLRQASQDLNVKVADLARIVADRRGDLDVWKP